MLLWTSLVLHVAGYPRCVPSPEIEMPEGHENTHFSREFDFQTRTHSLRGIAVPTMIYGTPTSCCGIILLLSVVSTTAGDGSDRDTTDWVAVSTPTESRSISLGHAPPHERSSWQRLTESNKDEEEITTDEMMKSPKLFSPVVRLLTAVACVEGLYRAFVMPIFPIHLTQHGYTPMEIAVLLSVFPFAGVITYVPECCPGTKRTSTDHITNTQVDATGKVHDIAAGPTPRYSDFPNHPGHPRRTHRRHLSLESRIVHRVCHAW